VITRISGFVVLLSAAYIRPCLALPPNDTHDGVTAAAPVTVGARGTERVARNEAQPIDFGSMQATGTTENAEPESFSPRSRNRSQQGESTRANKKNKKKKAKKNRNR